MKVHISKINLLISALIFIIILLCIIIGILINSDKLENNETDKNNSSINEQINDKLTNSQVNKEDVEKLFAITDYVIDPLGKFKNNNRITSSNLSNAQIMDYVFRYLFEYQLYETSKFDNSNYEYASDKQYEISKKQILESIKILFGDIKYDYFPKGFWYDHYFITFELIDDKYIGKQIITGALAEPGYEYVLGDYKVKENKLILNVYAAYSNVEYIYQDESLEKELFDYQTWYYDVRSNINNYVDNLISLEYTYKIKNDGYELESIIVK
ncbi:MAG: hypothetical protein E7164_01430 [Firmicutes bacterium]|nr:hypothetical protein [Bacillota bacterium]